MLITIRRSTSQDNFRVFNQINNNGKEKPVERRRIKMKYKEEKLNELKAMGKSDRKEN